MIMGNSVHTIENGSQTVKESRRSPEISPYSCLLELVSHKGQSWVQENCRKI